MCFEYIFRGWISGARHLWEGVYPMLLDERRDLLAVGMIRGGQPYKRGINRASYNTGFDGAYSSGVLLD